jgi:tetratricopeptide (TPR) repeat protein
VAPDGRGVPTFRERLLQAILLHQRGELETAIASYRVLLAEQPWQFDALRLLGAALAARGAHAQALQEYDRALRVRRDFAEVWTLRGASLSRLQRHAEAAESFGRAAALQPGNVDLLRLSAEAQNAADGSSTGNAPDSTDSVAADEPGAVSMELRRRWHKACELHRSGQLEPAVDLLRKIVGVAPYFADARRILGAALYQQGKPAEALPEIEIALQTIADSGELWMLHGRVLSALGRFDEALHSNGRALGIQPEAVAAWTDRGHLLTALRQMSDAVQCFERACLLDPQSPQMQYNEALALLAAGQFEAGWARHEARLRVADFQMMAIPGVPFWTGSENLQGRTLLVCGEQGLGDTIQFCRFLPLLASRGARVVLGVQPALRTCLAAVPGASTVVTDGEAMPAIDLQCWIMSLPHLLRVGADVLGSRVPYLKVPAARASEWRRRLSSTEKSANPVFRVGIVCSGNPRHANDRFRSIPLERFADLVVPQAGRAQWHLLQNALRPEDETWLQRLGIADHRAALTDFGEAAALTACMDSVVSVDTSLAHIAGAMGKPLHLLLPLPADWRWMEDRDESPWYPGARLWRQRRFDDWSDPLLALQRALFSSPR